MATLGFELEWYDNLSDTVQKLFLKYFIENKTIEVVSNRRTTSIVIDGIILIYLLIYLCTY
jgi:hypothetical protein